MKKIGFLSFGHWSPSPQSQTRSAADTLLQSIDLAVAADELGADGEPIGDGGKALERSFPRFADDLMWWVEAAKAQRAKTPPPY